VIVSIDGMRPDYVREADRYGLRIPELRRLLRKAPATGVAGVLPTVTYPSHATLVTGVAPARHGILANRPFDPRHESRRLVLVCGRPARTHAGCGEGCRLADGER
jgi:predicted AlkP superfamily pyrophosphatase or phosphodiesterase